MRIEQYAIDVAYIVLAACSVLAIADGDSDGDADSVGDEQSVRVLCTQLLSGMALVAAPPAAVLKWLRLAAKGNVAWRSTDPRLAALRHFLQAAGADAAAAACASGSTATATAAGRAQAARPSQFEPVEAAASWGGAADHATLRALMAEGGALQWGTLLGADCALTLEQVCACVADAALR